MPQKRLSVEDHDDEARDKKRCFTLSDNIITVAVGAKQLRHLVHESVLRKCPFFDKCLNSGMREQEDKAITLPEDDPEDFAIIVKWLYAEKIPDDLNWHQILRAYNAANKYCIPELQNALLDSLRSRTEDWRPSPEWVLHVWEQTVEGCQLRELALDLIHHHISKKPSRYREHPTAVAGAGGGGGGGNKENYAAQMERFMGDPQLGLALLWRFADPSTRRLRNPCKMTGCVYHVHEDGMTCP